MAKRKKAVIATAVDPAMKATFKQWWQVNNYASESEAVRALIREKNEEQEQKEITAGRNQIRPKTVAVPFPPIKE